MLNHFIACLLNLSYKNLKEILSTAPFALTSLIRWTVLLCIIYGHLHFVCLSDEAYVLAYAVILLNTTLHNTNAKSQSLGLAEEKTFVRTMLEFDDQTNLPEDLVRVSWICFSPFLDCFSCMLVIQVHVNYSFSSSVHMTQAMDFLHFTMAESTYVMFIV